MTLQEIYEAWSKETPDSKEVLQKFDNMALHFPVQSEEFMTKEQRKAYFTDTYYMTYVLPYVRNVERQAFIAAYKQAFQFFTELLKE